MTRAGRLAAQFGLAAGAVALIAAAWPGAETWFEGRSIGEAAWVAMYGAYAVLPASELVVHWGKAFVAFTHLAVWAALFLLAVSLYACRDDLQAFGAHVLSELDPGRLQPGSRRGERGCGSERGFRRPRGDRRKAVAARLRHGSGRHRTHGFRRGTDRSVQIAARL